jgi:hypothetical protein
VTPRHLILVISSVAVLAAGLYLFKEVRATPATAEVSKRTSPPTPPAPGDEEPEARPTGKVPETRPARIGMQQTPPPPPNPTPPNMTPGATIGADPPALENVNDELAKPNPRMDAVMAEANKAYDHGDFDEAKGIALKVLAKEPNNTRMLRIAVSAACIDGDSAEAQKHYAVLPPGDREQMKVRCARYGVSFNDK